MSESTDGNVFLRFCQIIPQIASTVLLVANIGIQCWLTTLVVKIDGQDCNYCITSASIASIFDQQHTIENK